jgi:hypothetical protein
MLDICCQWRNNIHEVFPTADVKLNLFHAVQHITKHIPDRINYRQEMLPEDHGQIMHQGDIGSSRTKPTLNAADLSTGFQNFIQKWENYKYENSTIFTPDIHTSCKNLLGHIQKGCLSDIEPGEGTNRNERIYTSF